jgi:tetratricopeptide (TPR) repeat protein|uniref:tetratricopeptide repeat protein n=1 Tax=Alistipes sp. TaxID=1872444 RepID=UPI0040575651
MKKLIMTVVALLGATTLFAQTDVVATFQQGVGNAKAGNYTEAIEQFQAIIDASWDIEEPDANQQKAIVGAKKFIVTCYNKMGVAAINAKNYETAIANFTEAANLAELYEDVASMNKNRTLIGQVYQVQGADAFNAEDYATAIAVFSKGYEADPRNTDMALNLAESYFKSDMYQEGMKVCTKIAALNPDKFAEAIAEAQSKMDMYTNNEVAKLQMANDYDGIIAMAEQLEDAGMAAKITMQAYYGKKDFNKMIELSQAALEAQATDEGRSDIYYLLGVAYNEKEQFDQAIAAMQKVTAGNNVANAQAVIAALTAK